MFSEFGGQLKAIVTENHNENQSVSELRAWLTLIFLSIIWGTSFILIKKTLVAFDPIEVGLLRVSISGLAFLPLFIYHFRKFEWSRWPLYLAIALTGSGVPAFLYATAQTKIDSATAGILNSMTPMLALVIGVLVFKNSTSKKQVIGILIGFIAAGGLIYIESGGSLIDDSILYGLLIVIGCVFYGTNVNLVPRYFAHVKSVRLSTFSFILMGLPTALIIPFTNIPSTVVSHPHGWTSLGAVTLLAVFSTVFAVIIFYRLIQQTNAVFASSVAYLVPVVALLWGFIDGESIGIQEILCLVVIIFSVYLIRSKP